VRRGQRDHEFEQFVAVSWPRLRRAAYLLSHDAHEADDLVQTALASAYARWSRIRQDDAYSYVHRAVVNAYIDTTRRRRPVPVERHPDRPGATGDPVNAVDDRSELTALLAPLSPRERTIIVWRYYLDAPEAEVAERLGVSTGTVKSTASRALARLRSTTTTQGENR
jgi:RNA polymerase sigma-70 factor (sigma-E family)